MLKCPWHSKPEDEILVFLFSNTYKPLQTNLSAFDPYYWGYDPFYSHNLSNQTQL